MLATRTKILLFAFAVFLASLLVSCEQKTGQDAEYRETPINSFVRSKKTAREASIKNIQRAIKVYRSVNGEYPESLEDVESYLGSPLDPELYQYNPQTGEIRLRR